MVDLLKEASDEPTIKETSTELAPAVEEVPTDEAGTDYSGSDPVPLRLGATYAIMAAGRYDAHRPGPAEILGPLIWRVSGYTGGGHHCALVAQVHTGPGRGGFLLRDRRANDGPVLSFSEQEWLALVEDIESLRGGHIT